jgi:hypothetical protein
MSVKAKATFPNRILNFKAKVKQLLKRVASKCFVWEGAKVDIEVTGDNDRRVGARGKRFNVRDEVRVIVAIRAPHLGVHEWKIDVDDMKMPSNTNTVKLNRARTRGLVPSEVAELASNKRATKHMRGLVGAYISK